MNTDPRLTVTIFSIVCIFTVIMLVVYTPDVDPGLYAERAAALVQQGADFCKACP